MRKISSNGLSLLDMNPGRGMRLLADRASAIAGGFRLSVSRSRRTEKYYFRR